MTAVQAQDTSVTGIDKWAALEKLTLAREAYGVNHRTLAVLRTLMTFLPERVLTTAHRSAVVFPSNATLSSRLNGMPESTLRRHLGTLVSAGIVSRHDSANRKRFARKAGQGTQVAFGFDLSPLARMWDALCVFADEALAQAEALAALRAEVAAKRQEVLVTFGETALTESARKALRNKPEATILVGLRDALTAEYATMITDQMSTSDNQNERHIEQELKSNSVREQGRTADNFQPDTCETIVAQCEEYKSYFPQTTLSWPGLACVADQLCPMMGIDRNVYAEAVQRIGLAPAVTAVLCILERLPEISNPGGFLRRLVQRGAGGKLCMRRLADMVKSGQNCQLTILERI